MHLKEFILKLYADESLAALCLKLQNEFNLNVNLLLSVVWFVSERENSIDESVWRELTQNINSFDDKYLKPLRSLRGSLKTLTAANGGNSLYHKTKALELEYEFFQIALINSILSAQKQESHAIDKSLLSSMIHKNLACYCKIAGIRESEKLQGILDSFSHRAACLLH